MISTFRGGFREYDAGLEAADDGSLRLTGSAEVASVDVRDENLAAHLQSPEFFDAEQPTPRIEFSSEQIDIDQGGAAGGCEGELTIRGITKPITATGRLEHVGADMERLWPGRGLARDHRRPARVRPRLERAAAEGRLRARR